MERKIRNVLIACTGSVATIKLPEIINKLSSDNLPIDCKISVIVTEHAKHFFKQEDISSSVQIYSDADEWQTWHVRGDPVLHIELSKWADILVIAPLDANSLAKIASGICDNLLLCTVRAWDIKKPILFCPAMNTKMWEHPITSKQINILKEWGYREVPCIAKTLMCGDTGLGAMAEIDTIVAEIIKYLVLL